MLYRNVNNGATIFSDHIIKGNGWEVVNEQPPVLSVEEKKTKTDAQGKTKVKK